MANKKKASDIIDFRSLFNSWLSHWYLFVISVVVCVGLGLLFCRWRMDEYGVRANVLIQKENTSPFGGGSMDKLFGSSGQVDDEIFVISSHSIYRDVVRDLGLNKTHYVRLGFLKKELAYPEFPIDVYAPEGLCDTLRVGLAFRVKVDKKGLADVTIIAKGDKIDREKDVKLPHTFKTPYGDFTVAKTDFYPEGKAVTSNILIEGYHAAAERIATEIGSTIAAKRSSVINMSFNTPNPAMGEALLAEIIEKYNQRGIAEKNLQNSKTLEFINGRIALLASDLSTAEGNIQDYKERQGIVSVGAEASYQTAKKSQMEQRLIAAETELGVIDMARSFINDPSNRYEIVPATLGSDGVGEAIEKYNELLFERQEMMKTVKGDNSALKRLNAQVDALRANLIAAVNQTYANKQKVLREIKAEMGSVSGHLSRIPTQERAFIDMERQRNVKQQLYLFLLEKQEETAIMLANTTPKGTVVDVPYTLIKPLGVSRRVILIFCFLIGLCLPPVFLYLRKLIRNRMETKEEIEGRTDIPVIGEICADTSGRSLVSVADGGSTVELFNLMRSNLQFILNGADDKVVLVTSTNPGEGKSFISLNLAASLARLNGKKVLLMGMDVRAARLAEYLGIHPQYGLTQYLAGSDIQMQQLITAAPMAEVPTLDVIVAGPVPPNPSELLASEKVDAMVKTLRGLYDYIIIDSAPVGVVSDTFSLDRVADATVYVTRVNVTSGSDIDFAEEIYRDKRLKKLSLVVNGTKTKKAYGYGYGHQKA